MMSAVSFIVMLLIMITIPTLLYSFFFLINCPPSPLEFLWRRSPNAGDFESGTSKMTDHGDGNSSNNKNNTELVIMSSKLGKDIECVVCLSIFVEGEQLRQLNVCKHLFHKGCVDKWLSTHFNCPVCRAFVNSQFKPKEKESRVSAPRNVGRNDLWQGLPDAAGLV